MAKPILLIGVPNSSMKEETFSDIQASTEYLKDEYFVLMYNQFTSPDLEFHVLNASKVPDMDLKELQNHIFQLIQPNKNHA